MPDKRERGRRSIRVYVVALLIVAAVGGIWVANFTTRHFANPDAYDYAQMGRQVRAGRGMTTLHVLPRHIPYLRAQGYLDARPVPNLYRYPMPILTNAMFQLFTADPVRAAIVQCGAWFLLSVLVFFFFTERSTDWMFASLATLAFLSDPSFWVHSYSGMTESLSTLLVLMVVYLLHSRAQSEGRWFLIGLFSGTAYLTRYQLGILVPVAVAVLWLRTSAARRRRAATIAFFGFAVIVTPWLLRNLSLTGDPFFSFSTAGAMMVGSCPTDTYLDWKLHEPSESGEVFRLYGAQIWNKFLRTFWPGVLNPFVFTGSRLYGALTCWILLSSLFTWRTESARRHGWLKCSVLVLVLGNFAVVCLAYPTFRFFEPLHPLLLVVGLLSGAELTDRFVRPLRRPMVRLLFVAIVASGLLAYRIHSSGQRSAARDHALVHRGSYELVSQWTHERSTIASDVSYRIALFSQRLGVRLPVPDPTELLEIDREYLPIDYVLFSRKVVAAEPVGPDETGNGPCSGEVSVGDFFRSPYGRYNAFMLSEEFQERFEWLRDLPNGDALYGKR